MRLQFMLFLIGITCFSCKPKTYKADMQTVMSLAVSFERSAVVLKRAMEYTVDDIYRKSSYVIRSYMTKMGTAPQIATVTDSFTVQLDTRGKSGLQKVIAQFSYLDPNTGKPATIQRQIEYNVIP